MDWWLRMFILFIYWKPKGARQAPCPPPCPRHGDAHLRNPPSLGPANTEESDALLPGFAALASQIRPAPVLFLPPTEVAEGGNGSQAAFPDAFSRLTGGREGGRGGESREEDLAILL